MPELLHIQPIAPEATYALRHQVLWPDKPLDYVKIAEDAAGHHFGALRAGEVVAVISLFVTGPEARFRKFATRPDCQRQGIGSELLKHVFAEAQRLGAKHIWCDARQDSAAFYARFGMQPEGEIFYKGPVAYVRMACTL
ncbi:GNAT family N-acetyltransferase [Hymenobacter properus]|uniref:GNAT family N-acetyltransferase n=1 Tax=Hymenobacter properus TaxID=2791026 RepID=A0A931FHT2_9BACT|nr:GNAT family N-acetyltransferase [Hymenobacter properus]MBF9141372.1 GNAT family N-acetyltransferase [Hymenobacter properus]MBR7720181.1 GNAT family N-acetyltransferase [Microvirga sp. SRT04]